MQPDEARRSAPVWDPLVRIGHWTLAAGVAAAWITKEGSGRLHEWIGYATLALVVIRIAWGFAGPRYARFNQFVRAPGATLAYAARVVAGNEPRYLGHNPLGGWMIVVLLATVAATGVTGWLYTTDRFWGIEWMEDLHEALAILVLVLAALHVTGVIVASLRHRENLVAAMFHGRKREATGDDVA